MKNILPEWLYKSIEQNYKLDDVYELRIRQNKPIQICYKGKYLEIKKSDGLYQHPIIASKEIIEFIISLATKNSLYAYEDQIKNGYIVTDNGIRIGLCGTVVTRNEQVTFIKNITSLNLRIAHRIQGCSRKIINYIISNSTVKNTLIISEPGAGKTTLLRDMVEVLSKQFNIPNILVIDERFELAGLDCGFDIGESEVMSGVEKKIAYEFGIRSMSPTLIVTDEIFSEADAGSIEDIVRCGVKVFASIHGESLKSLKENRAFHRLLSSFEVYVTLAPVGKVVSVEYQ